MAERKYLIKYYLSNEPSKVEEMQFDLHLMGITSSTIFPDFDGIAAELANEY
jgi:hypothetical protein